MRAFLLTVLVAVAAAAAPPDRAPAVDDYTALLYHFDGTGDVLQDAGPFAVDLDRGAAGRAEGRFGGALDPRTGAVRVPYSGLVDAVDGLTLEAWVKVDGPADDLQRIAYRSSVYGLYLDQSGRSLTWYVNVGGAWTSVAARVPQGEWVHLAGTYDGQALRVWLNGEVQAEKELPGTVFQSSAPLELGGEVAGERRRLNGLIDEVRLSTVARDDFTAALHFTPTVEATPATPPAGAIPVVLPEITVGHAAAPPTVDGKLDDGCWAGAVTVALKDPKPGTPITQATTALLCWDDARLYLAVRCRDGAVDKLKAEVTDRDGSVWSDDSVEVFLRPAGSAAYYHFAVNAKGALYDAKAQDAGWNSGAVAAAQVGEGEWTVELAVPLADFPGADFGQPWRGNVCRSRSLGGELSSWAPVGGRFHSPGRFGIWRFGQQPSGPAETRSVLVGQVRNPAGEPIAGLPISSAAGTARTDGWGRFRLEGLPRGKNLLVVSSPRYQPLAVEVDLTATEERVVLPPVQAVDPYALGYDVAPNDRGFHVYAVEPLDDVDPSTPLPAEQEQAPLRAFACAGEYEPVGATIVAAKALSGVTVAVSPLAGPAGATIPAEALDLRLVKRIFMRLHYSRPAEEVALRDRYLLHPEPFDMAAGSFRRVHLMIHVPEDAKAGTYQGALTIAAGAATAELPVQLEVLPVRLDASRRHYSLYYRGAGDDAIVRAELADIRAHGADRLLWNPRIDYVAEDGQVKPDFTQLEATVGLMREYGFQPPWIVWDGFERLSAMTDGETGTGFLAAAKQTVLAVRKLFADNGWGEVVLTHMDEVFNRERLDRYINLAKAIRQVPEQRIYITFHSQPRPEVAAMTREIDPYVDIRCYHGHSIDHWVSAGHSFEEFGQQLNGDEAWCYYNLRGQPENAEWARLTNGYWLWLTPVTTHVPWAYSSFRGDPLDDADGYDFGYAFPVNGEVIPTRQWEGYREGIDDLRYLSTLENLLDAARQKGLTGEAVTAAAKWLADLRAELLGLPVEEGQSAYVLAMVNKYAEADYDRWRRECAGHIVAVRQALGQ